MSVILSLCVSTPGKLKSVLDRGGNRTRNLWCAGPMLYQLSYVRGQVGSIIFDKLPSRTVAMALCTVCLIQYRDAKRNKQPGVMYYNVKTVKRNKLKLSRR